MRNLFVLCKWVILTSLPRFLSNLKYPCIEIGIKAVLNINPRTQITTLSIHTPPKDPYPKECTSYQCQIRILTYTYSTTASPAVPKVPPRLLLFIPFSTRDKRTWIIKNYANPFIISSNLSSIRTVTNPFNSINDPVSFTSLVVMTSKIRMTNRRIKKSTTSMAKTNGDVCCLKARNQSRTTETEMNVRGTIRRFSTVLYPSTHKWLEIARNRNRKEKLWNIEQSKFIRYIIKAKIISQGKGSLSNKENRFLKMQKWQFYSRSCYQFHNTKWSKVVNYCRDRSTEIILIQIFSLVLIWNICRQIYFSCEKKRKGSEIVAMKISKFST